MEEKALSTKVAMHITRGCLVIPIQVELYAETLLQIQESALEKIKETGIKGMLIDVSAIEVIDSFLGKTLSDTARMAAMLGATTIFTGFKPGVAAALVDLDVKLGDIQTAIDLEEGFQKLKPIVEPQEPPEEVEEFPEAAGEEEAVEAKEETGEVEEGYDEAIEDEEDEEGLREEEPEDET